MLIVFCYCFFFPAAYWCCYLSVVNFIKVRVSALWRQHPPPPPPPPPIPSSPSPLRPSWLPWISVQVYVIKPSFCTQKLHILKKNKKLSQELVTLQKRTCLSPNWTKRLSMQSSFQLFPFGAGQWLSLYTLYHHHSEAVGWIQRSQDDPHQRKLM